MRDPFSKNMVVDAGEMAGVLAAEPNTSHQSIPVVRIEHVKNEIIQHNIFQNSNNIVSFFKRSQKHY